MKPILLSYEWMSGHWIGSDGLFTVLNRGLSYGDGFFDTLSIWNGHILFSHEHERKCTAAASALRLLWPPSLLDKLTPWLLDVNEGVARIYVFRDEENAYPIVFARLQPKKLADRPATFLARVSDSITQPASVVFKHKTLNRLPFLEAEHQVEAGYGVDALLQSPDRALACGSVANLVWGVKEGIYTLPPENGFLRGAALQAFEQKALEKCVLLVQNQLYVKDCTPSHWLLGINSLGPRIYTALDGIVLQTPPKNVLGLLQEMYPFWAGKQ